MDIYIVQGLTDQALQNMTLILPNGDPIGLTIYFIPMQTGWFITSLTYKAFTLNGVRIVNSPNFLYQFKNKLPFGMGCYSSQQREPSQQEDFSSGASKLFILNSAGVEAVTELIQNG